MRRQPETPTFAGGPLNRLSALNAKKSAMQIEYVMVNFLPKKVMAYDVLARTLRSYSRSFLAVSSRDMGAT